MSLPQSLALHSLPRKIWYLAQFSGSGTVTVSSNRQKVNSHLSSLPVSCLSSHSSTPSTKEEAQPLPGHLTPSPVPDRFKALGKEFERGWEGRKGDETGGRMSG